MSCQAHADLPVEVRPKEEPSPLCSSPSACEETRAPECGVEPSSGGCQPSVRSRKRSLPRRRLQPRKGPTGSRAWCKEAKAREGVKPLEGQPPRTRRRSGRGTVAQPAWEQERPVSTPAVRRARRHLAGGLGVASPLSRDPAKGARVERESEWPIVLGRSGTTPPRRREGATLGRRVLWR